MKAELRFFKVFPSVVKAGEKSEITIEPGHKFYTFQDAEYTIRIVAKEKRDIPRNAEYTINNNKFPEIKVKPQNGKIIFSYEFKDEQEYKIIVFTSKNVRTHVFSIYALEEDLYDTMPFRGDLHIHSDHSDGIGSLCEVMSAYRENGYDFICITDHHKYYPSVKAKEMFENVDTGLTIFPGEEVHNCDMGYFHIINFNGKYSVNEVIESDYENLKKKLCKAAKEISVPESIDPYEFVFRKWICDEIRKSGGKAIFPHPYWTIYDEYHVETHMSFYTLKSGIYDIFEVLGGCTVNENQLQVSMYNELRAEGVDLPIVGSTDAHDFVKGERSYFDCHSTLVFAKDRDGIVDAVMNKNAVAVQTICGETPRVYGKFRLVKYAIFLMENFYPVYKGYTSDIGSLMRAYKEYGDCKESLERVNSKAQEFKNRYFGRKAAGVSGNTPTYQEK